MDKIDGLFLGNTVLERGLVVSPVIVAATTLQNSVILAIAYAVITFLTVFCTSFTPKAALHHPGNYLCDICLSGLYSNSLAAIFVDALWRL